VGILFPELKQRDRQPELMDDPSLDPELHAQALRGLARVNWISGTGKGFFNTIRPLAEQTTPDHPLHVLDVACGGGDIAIEIARRARDAGIPLKVSGCDISPTAIELATQRAEADAVDVEFFVADAINKPLREVDVTCSSLFLHHLEEADAVRLLERMRDASRQMLLLSDLIRSRWGYFTTWWGIRMLSRSPICHIDGPLSVRAAFRVDEALQLANQAKLTDATLTRLWPERYLLKWIR